MMFWQLLDENAKYEKEALQKICKLYKVKLMNMCNNSDYDFKTDDKIMYEVKADHLVEKTNNFFIEFFGYKKPSGISISLSNFYIITNTKNYYLISTEKLKKLCENCAQRKTPSGTYGYILKKNILILNSIEI
jgi:hypothetical protein